MKRNRIQLLIILFILAIHSTYQAKALDIIFRYDDFILRDDSFQDSLIEVFSKADIPLHIGVIPFNADITPKLQMGASVERVKMCHQQGKVIIATHGFCHKENPCGGEFSGLTDEEQRFRLKSGTQFLDSVFSMRSHIFIPPWNGYDKITLEVLADLGYDILSASLGKDKAMFDSRLQYYPYTATHPIQLKEIIKYNAHREGLVVCVFHKYDFSDSYSLFDLHNLLNDITNNSFLSTPTMEELYCTDKSFGFERMKANCFQPLLTKIFKTRQIILPTKDITILRIYDLLFHLLLILCVAIIGSIIFRVKSIWYWAAQAILFVLGGVQTWCQFFSPKSGLLLIVTLSISIVLISYCVKKCRMTCSK